ncbi:MAG TPA: HAD hydrolase family protein [Terriglobales bacterium]|nr:HAD hydrolase family protein [Terriglobales bacterium]
MSKGRAKRIKLILMDVDGVLTDGTIWLFPATAGAEQQTASAAAARADAGGYAISSANIVEAKGFHAHDGTAISLARLAGIKTGVITKRISETVALRARDLRLDHVHQGAADKVAVLEGILAQEKLEAREVAYLGDDIIDLPVMRRCGLAIATANARKEVKQEAHIVTRHAGGAGAARDAVEYILRAQGKWTSVMHAYLNERVPPKK